jgi:hypothetical protein
MCDRNVQGLQYIKKFIPRVNRAHTDDEQTFILVSLCAGCKQIQRDWSTRDACFDAAVAWSFAALNWLSKEPEEFHDEFVDTPMHNS